MRALVPALFLLTASQPLLAQAHVSELPQSYSMVEGPQHWYSSYSMGAPQLPSDRTCLTRKSNGRTECHTFAEWKKIADNLTEKPTSGR
jgi:hypothetical protein